MSNAEDVLHDADLLVEDAKDLLEKAISTPGVEIEPWMQEDLRIVKAVSALIARFFYKDEKETFEGIISEISRDC